MIDNNYLSGGRVIQSQGIQLIFFCGKPESSIKFSYFIITAFLPKINLCQFLKDSLLLMNHQRNFIEPCKRSLYHIWLFVIL